MIKNKFKVLLSEMKKFSLQKTLVLQYNEGNNRKIFHSSTKLNASNSDIDEAFKSMNESTMTKIKELFL